MLLRRRIPLSFLFSKIKNDFIAISIFVILIACFDRFIFHVSIPLVAATVMGTTISLLLAFRTAQAYDRWWEARIVWGKILSDSRSLIRQLQSFCKSGFEDIIYKSARIQAAWCYALSQSLRELPATQGTEDYFTEAELEEVNLHSNVPIAILSLHARMIKELLEKRAINEYQQVQIDDTLVLLCDGMGKSERIKHTVFPQSYSRALRILFYLFATLMTFALAEYSILVVCITNILIVSAFFLIENTATLIQDPFENRPTDISSQAVSRTIEINLMQMVEANDIPEPLEDQGFYIM